MSIRFNGVARSLAAIAGVAGLGMMQFGLPTCLGAAKPVAKQKVAVAKTLPMASDFTLADAGGVKRRLSDYRGRAVALYFFCGCEWCHRTARIWGQMQHGDALPQGDASHKAPVTIVVFAGNSADVRQFAGDTDLDASTVLLPDENMHVTLDLYDAEPCPRVFVINPAGYVVYTNNHKDDQARKAPEIVIASRALSALREISARPG